MANNKHKDTLKDNPSGSTSDIDKLNENEKLAFEKIIGELGDVDENAISEKDGDVPVSSDIEKGQKLEGQQQAAQEGQSNDDLDDEQQAALDKIMNEINGDDKKKSESEDNKEQDQKLEEPQQEQQDQSNDDLDDEQQAALDKIMAEIGGDDKQDSESEDNKEQDQKLEEPQQEQQDQSNDDLNDEQQAALDKIMNEISGDDKQDSESEDNKEQDQKLEEPTDELNDDQQAALDKIMNEINGDEEETLPDKDHPQSPSEKSIEEDSQKLAPPSDKTQLSLEEFNEELTNLLSNPITEKESESVQPKAAPTSKNAEPDHEAATKDPEASKNTSTSQDDKANKGDDYSILHEVTDSDEKNPETNKKEKPKKRSKHKKATPKKNMRYTVTAILTIAIAATAYWQFVLPKERSTQTLLSSQPSKVEKVPSNKQSSSQTKELPNTSPQLPTILQENLSSIEQSNQSLNSLIDNITSSRNYVLNKIEEIKELKFYYQSKVNEEYSKLNLTMASFNISSLKAALDNKQIELGLRSAQRRLIYIKKLDIPIKMLSSSSEELLYLERKTRVLKILETSIRGLSISEFKKEVSEIIQKHLKNSKDLSIDHIHVDPPSFKIIWADFKRKNEKKYVKQGSYQSDQDIKINKEICKGNFERKYLLNTLTPESAKCLAEWTGKDLYLNSLTSLPPSAAKAISQWPGEWLSLNGLKRLPPESAKYLSQWKGKRISLNGLSNLSQKATQYLSQWKGEQIEMVGLTSIGRWENYGTRLYLSETLRKKLQLQ